MKVYLNEVVYDGKVTKNNPLGIMAMYLVDIEDNNKTMLVAYDTVYEALSQGKVKIENLSIDGGILQSTPCNLEDRKLWGNLGKDLKLVDGKPIYTIYNIEHDMLPKRKVKREIHTKVEKHLGIYINDDHKLLVTIKGEGVFITALKNIGINSLILRDEIVNYGVYKKLIPHSNGFGELPDNLINTNYKLAILGESMMYFGALGRVHLVKTDGPKKRIPGLIVPPYVESINSYAFSHSTIGTLKFSESLTCMLGAFTYSTIESLYIEINTDKNYIWDGSFHNTTIGELTIKITGNNTRDNDVIQNLLAFAHIGKVVYV